MLCLADNTIITIDGASLLTAAATLGGVLSASITVASRAILAAMRERQKVEQSLEEDRREFESGLIQKVAEAIQRFDTIDAAGRKQNSDLNIELIKIAQTTSQVLTGTVENMRILQTQVSELKAHAGVVRREPGKDR